MPIDGPVLVTGATGFIGSHVVDALTRQGADLHALVRPGRERLVRGATPWVADLRDADGVARVVAGVRPRVVFHLAGDTAGRGRVDAAAFEDALAVNLAGTLALWRALATEGPALCRVVTAGGLEEYGNGPVPFVETQREQPVSAYSASQVAATHLSQVWHRTHGLPVVVLRFALVYGPGQAATFLIPALIEACLDDRDFALTAGTQTREYVFIDDVVSAVLRAATVPGADGTVLNIGDGVERQVADVAHAVVRRLGCPARLQVGGRAPRTGEVVRMVSDPARAQAVLGWAASTSFDDGLARTIAWHQARAQGRLASPGDSACR